MRTSTFVLDIRKSLGLPIESATHRLHAERAERRANRQSPVNRRLANLLRRRLCIAVYAYHKGKRRGGSAVRNLGCTLEELRIYLEARFTPGMTWENWGPRGWHIDHVVPLSHFDLTDPEQAKAACHFSNLQPLWAAENWKKGAR